MRRIHFLFSILLVAPSACSDDTSDAMNNAGPDAAAVEDASTTSNADAAVSSEPDANGHEDGGTNADTGEQTLDAGSPEQDAGVIFSLCNPSFAEADACGGDLEGSWKYSEGCLDPSSIGMVSTACQGAVLRNELQVATGTITFTSTMSYHRILNDNYSVDIEVPASCVSFVGSCMGIESTIELFEPRAQVNCLMSVGGGCDCSLEIKKRVNDRGQYELTSAGVVRMIPDDSSMTQGDYHYCVDQGMLHYKGFSTDSADHSVSYVLTP